MGRRIIDMHHHISSADQAEDLASRCGALGIEKVVLLGLPPNRDPASNDTTLNAGRSHPGLFIPFAGFDLDGMQPDDLEVLRDRGFKGVKFIGPARAYNATAYFPVYEKAARLKLPGVFHTGIVANKGAWRDCDSSLMRPVFLDHIARRVPEFTMVMAHLGNPWSEEGAMACRWNPNLFCDLSGSLLKYRSPEFVGSLLWWSEKSAYKSPDGTSAWEKIVFGSDVAPGMVADVVNDYFRMMSTLNLQPHIQDRIWYGTAARLLGL